MMFTIKDKDSLPTELVNDGVLKGAYLNVTNDNDTICVGDLREFIKDIPDSTQVVFLNMTEERDHSIVMINLFKDNSQVTNHVTSGVDTLALISV